ncbi:hypothetical protein [Frigoribacterium sp. CFBP9030]|uniref:hypothetical protein n=1 Tax=Frigoribacterium sp. CFBP9030 TaxID=3096537 RepID=UPI002A6AB715|nr:hypothetical protein [Frigoribacterium sp. CFBP9030]MDY0891893.1 hypothetical protein [Frigoribacterium sp. CFBP9030]
MSTTPANLAPAADERPQLAELGTQIANPIRATVRTVVQFLVGAVPVLNLSAGITIALLNEQLGVVVLPGWVFFTLNGILVVTGLLIALVTRLMANPIVNGWIALYLPWLAPLKRS